jgi:ribosomal protein S18 acetylase RimI-like enzyme
MPAIALEIRPVDWLKSDESHAVVEVLNSYASHVVGGGVPLSSEVRANLATELSKRPHAIVLLAWSEGHAVGLVIAFEGFSTFACRPLINIHALAVLPKFQCRGVGKALMAAIETEARRRGCCKLTLEVLEHNQHARKLYDAVGFASYQLDPTTGRALFLEKKLS